MSPHLGFLHVISSTGPIVVRHLGNYNELNTSPLNVAMDTCSMEILAFHMWATRSARGHLPTIPSQSLWNELYILALCENPSNINHALYDCGLKINGIPLDDIISVYSGVSTESRSFPSYSTVTVSVILSASNSGFFEVFDLSTDMSMTVRVKVKDQHGDQVCYRLGVDWEQLQQVSPCVFSSFIISWVIGDDIFINRF